MNQTKVKGSWFRAVLGIFIAYLIFALIGLFSFLIQYCILLASSEAILAWILFPVINIILLLYSYGWLGVWLISMEESRSAVLRIIGKVFGVIGFFLRPYPLMAFGANKKQYFVLFVALPFAGIGIASIILGATGTQILPLPDGNWSAAYITFGVFALLNSLFAFLTKKCPNCGCLMGKIDYDYLSSNRETYTRQYSRTVGSVSDGDGNSVDINALYDVEHEGRSTTQVKTFTCSNCGTKRQGRTMTIHEMSTDDIRRNS